MRGELVRKVAQLHKLGQWGNVGSKFFGDLRCSAREKSGMHTAIPKYGMEKQPITSVYLKNTSSSVKQSLLDHISIRGTNVGAKMNVDKIIIPTGMKGIASSLKDHGASVIGRFAPILVSQVGQDGKEHVVDVEVDGPEEFMKNIFTIQQEEPSIVHEEVLEFPTKSLMSPDSFEKRQKIGFSGENSIRSLFGGLFSRLLSKIEVFRGLFSRFAAVGLSLLTVLLKTVGGFYAVLNRIIAVLRTFFYVIMKGAKMCFNYPYASVLCFAFVIIWRYSGDSCLSGYRNGIYENQGAVEISRT